MGAKEAAALVKEEFSPIGDLFGISHQGVASLYHLANARDWEFADVMDGTSRYWVVEFFDQYTSRIGIRLTATKTAPCQAAGRRGATLG